MLRISLYRVGRKNHAQFRVVVAQKTVAAHGKFIERLGFYDPHTKKINLDQEKLLAWINKGAQPSNTVAKLMAQSKINHPRVKVIIAPKKLSKKEQKEKLNPQKSVPIASSASGQLTSEPIKNVDQPNQEIDFNQEISLPEEPEVKLADIKVDSNNKIDNIKSDNQSESKQEKES